MQILGIRFSKISGENFLITEKPQQINVNFSVNFSDFKFLSLQTPIGKASVLRVSFKISVTYSPRFGELSLEGFLDLKDEFSKREKNIIKNEKKLPDNISSYLINMLFSESIGYLSLISKLLLLPPPIPLPPIQTTSESRPEVA